MTSEAPSVERSTSVTELYVPPPPAPRRFGTLRSQRKAHRRQDILSAAMQLASARGVFGLSLGDLAAHVGTSKSTLLLHFGTKEGLALAMVEEAERVFFADVVLPALEAGPGLLRLRTLAERWIDYVPRSWDGGCLLVSLGHEFDGRDGPVKERLQGFVNRLRHAVVAAAEDAVRRGEIRNVGGDDVMFSLFGIVLALNLQTQMGERERSAAEAQRALAWLLNDLTQK